MSRLYAALDLPLDWAREQDPVAPAPRLPVLERLGARGDRAPASGDWRRWALARVGLEAPEGDLPLGRLAAEAAGLAPDAAASWLLATPVRLRASLTDIALAALVPVPGEAQRQSLAARFNEAWRGTPYRLHALAHGFVLASDEALSVETHDPEPLIGRSPPKATGPDAARLRALGSEIEMWLHGEGGESGNALWLWGAGRAPLAGEPRWPALATPDAALAAARRVHPGPSQDARLERWSLGTLAGEADPLASAERAWFRPLAAALARGQLREAELHLAGLSIHVRPGQRLRLWRRTRPWWELAA